jgi:hypothetical protein
MLSFLISTIVFCVAAFFLHRYLDEWGLDKGRARTLVVMVVASLLSWGAMALVDHFTGSPGMMENALKLQQQMGSF